MLSGIFSTPAQAAAKDFSFTLPAATTTSAGVYQTDGTLIRTLWSKKSLPAGTNSAIWDGLDDQGQPAAGGNYQIKVLRNNVTYEWQGTIGNTSALQTGPTVHRGFSVIHDLAITGTSMFGANGYNEGQATWRRMGTGNPNSVNAWGRIDQARPFSYVAADGTNVYYANTGNGWVSTWPSFVVAFKVSDNSEVTFSSGVTETAAGGGSETWNSVIDRELGEANVPTGIAVQTGGTYLFVSHGGLNQIRVLNKTTGAFVRNVTATAPGRLATTTDGHLWAICTESGSHVVRRYNVDAAGNLALASVITGLSDPLALAVSPSNGTIAIADGGTSQQVKGFANVASGTPASQWTLGTAGGYNAANGPNVTNTKFSFVAMSANDLPKQSFLAYQPDGSLWVGDPGNQRNLHFTPSRTYDNQVAHLGRNYSSTVCSGTPTRVFAEGWLEFTVDYSPPTKPSWTLAKNWAAGLPDNIVKGAGLCAVHKLSNNRTYATARNLTTGKTAILELTTTGARLTGIEVLYDQTLHEDGSLRWLTYGSKSFVNIQTLSGFDGSGNPLWNAATVLASSPTSQLDPQGNSGYRPNGSLFPSTSSGKVLLSDGLGTKNAFHLAALNTGGTKWLWRAAPTGMYFDGKGQVGNGSYPVNNSFVQGQEIVLGCHGEFYTPPSGRTGQANQFMHYWDNGLLIGEFGTDIADLDNWSINFYSGVIAKMAGNAFTPAFVTVGNSKYVWHNDEGHAGGVHCWKIGNTSSIAEIIVNLTLPATGGNGTGLTGQYFAGANFDTLKLTRTDPVVDFYWTVSPDAALGIPTDYYTVRWSGLVQPLYTQAYTFYIQSDDGVRLWVNGNKIIDNWTDHGLTENTSTTVNLTAGQKYTIVMEHYDAAGAAVAQLSWSSASQTKGVIPFSQLYPSNAIAINCAGPAVGRFQADPKGTTDSSAVSTTSAITVTGLNDPAPMSVYQTARQRSSQYDLRDLTPYANYKVRLHLAEFAPGVTAPGQRVFKAGVNNMGFITPNIDIVSEAGSALKATIREYVASANNRGELRLTFEETPNWSWIGGFEVVRDVSDQATNPRFAPVGSGTGLKGQYYSGLGFTPLTLTRTDPEINFDWTGVNPATSVGPNNFSVRWTGQIQTIDAGNYTFFASSDEGERVWINKVLVIDKWGVAGTNQAIVALVASTRYDIKVEYQQTTGNSFINLQWKRPNGYQEVVPLTQLYPAP